MALRIKIPTKQVEFNNKLFNIPKLGINYYKKVSDSSDIQEALDSIIFEINENPTKAEYEYILLNLSAYNGLLKDVVEYKGKQYSIEDVKESSNMVFKINGEEVKPKPLPPNYIPKDVLSVLRDSFENYEDLPAYALNWADKLLTSIELVLEDKTLNGLIEIQEFFDEQRS